MESTDEQREAFGAALLRQLEGRNRADFMTQIAALSGESVTRAALQQWLAGTSEPSRRKVDAIERCLNLRPGALSRLLGWVPASAVPTKSVLQAIDEDTNLSEKARRILKGSYREFTRG